MIGANGLVFEVEFSNTKNTGLECIRLVLSVHGSVKCERPIRFNEPE